MPKTTLIDCCIKKYAYREVSQIYQELEIYQDGLNVVFWRVKPKKKAQSY